MPLRGKKPVERVQRLKLLLYGPAGVGKTMASIQMPRPYIIDTEQGSVHYGDVIEKAGGETFETTDVQEATAEVRTLITEKHPFLTVVIDPVTTIFNTALDDAEKLVGTEFGRHYGQANKWFSRLCSLLIQADMNVIVTAHSKKEYGDDFKVLGQTFDGYKKLDYLFDLVLFLDREKGVENAPRSATVVKTRLKEFKDGETFPWAYAELVKRYGKDRLERGVSAVKLATPDQVEEFERLYARLTADEQKKADKAVGGGEVKDLPADRIVAGLRWIKDQLAKANAA